MNLTPPPKLQGPVVLEGCGPLQLEALLDRQAPGTVEPIVEWGSVLLLPLLLPLAAAARDSIRATRPCAHRSGRTGVPAVQTDAGGAAPTGMPSSSTGGGGNGDGRRLRPTVDGPVAITITGVCSLVSAASRRSMWAFCIRTSSEPVVAPLPALPASLRSPAAIAVLLWSDRDPVVVPETCLQLVLLILSRNYRTHDDSSLLTK